MSLIATAVKHLLAAGVTGDALVAAIADLEACAPSSTVDVSAARRRERDAAYQAEKRALRKTSSRRQTSADSADDADSPPPNDIYSNPPPLSPDASHPPRGRARQAGAFPKPDWADGQVWSDFLANRKTKRLPNTATAHRKLLADIERIADAAWPPGRLLSVATGKGWGAIYPSIKTLDDENRNGQRNQHDRSGGWAPRPGMEGVEPASLDDDDPRYSARH